MAGQLNRQPYSITVVDRGHGEKFSNSLSDKPGSQSRSLMVLNQRLLCCCSSLHICTCPLCSSYCVSCAISPCSFSWMTTTMKMVMMKQRSILPPGTRNLDNPVIRMKTTDSRNHDSLPPVCPRYVFVTYAWYSLLRHGKPGLVGREKQSVLFDELDQSLTKIRATEPGTRLGSDQRQEETATALEYPYRCCAVWSSRRTRSPPTTTTSTTPRS